MIPIPPRSVTSLFDRPIDTSPSPRRPQITTEEKHFTPKPPHESVSSTRMLTTSGAPRRGREHFALLQQLRNSMREAIEAPPPEADLKLLSRRRHLLKKVLKEVEAIGVAEIQHQHAAQEERRRAAEEAERERVSKSIIQARMKQAQFMYAHANMCDERNERMKAAAEKDWNRHVACLAHRENTLALRFSNLCQADARREAQLAALEARRQQEARELRQRVEEADARANNVRKRRQKQEEKDRQAREGAYQHRQQLRKEAEERQEMIHKEMTLAKEKEHDRRRACGPATKSHVFFRGPGSSPVVTVTEADHAARVAAFEAKQTAQRERYAEEQEFRDEYRRILRDKRDARLERANQNRMSILDSRLEAHAMLKARHRKQDDYVAEQRRARSARLAREGTELANRLFEHQRKRDERIQGRADDVARDTYNRWAMRTEAAVQDLLGRYHDARAARAMMEDQIKEQQNLYNNSKKDNASTPNSPKQNNSPEFFS